MGEEADANDYDRLPYDGVGGGGDDDDEGRVLEWEIGLPNADDLTPLSQSLIPQELASAFSISPEPARTIRDVRRASQNTLSSLRRQTSSSSSAALKSFSPFPSSTANDDPMVLEADDPKDGAGESSPKIRRSEAPEDSTDDQSARTLKRPRLVWTPQLHKRFVDVVAHLGIKNAVPKTIMQLMNVEGLTRENVASHLQKYRLYLKRMQGLSNEGPSLYDHLFASTPVPQSLHENPPPPSVPMPLQYAVPSMIPMPVYGMPHHHGHSGHMGMVPVNNHHGFETQQHYGAFGEQRPEDWPSGNKFGLVVSYPPRVMPNDK